MSNGRQIYKTRIRMGYHESNDGLRISLPDKYCFPALVAHVHFRDQKHIVLEQDKSKDTTWTSELCRSSTTPGCRYIVIPGVKLIGTHFRMCCISFVSEGPNFVLRIPDETERRPPKRRRIGATLSGQVKVEPVGEVLVDVLGQHLGFAIPTSELFALILDWQGKGYAK